MVRMRKKNSAEADPHGSTKSKRQTSINTLFAVR